MNADFNRSGANVYIHCFSRFRLLPPSSTENDSSHYHIPFRQNLGNESTIVVDAATTFVAKTALTELKDSGIFCKLL